MTAKQHRGRETRRAVTAQIMFRVGSVTKAFTALAIRQLAERRRLSLNGKYDFSAGVARAPTEAELTGARMSAGFAFGGVAVRYV
jgi:hypothetical protein